MTKEELIIIGKAVIKLGFFNIVTVEELLDSIKWDNKRLCYTTSIAFLISKRLNGIYSNGRK